MNRWISLFGAALAAAPAPLCAQSTPIIVSGQLATAPDSATVTVYEPMPGVPLNYFFTDGPNVALVRGGRFTYQLRHGQTGFIRYDGKYAPSGVSFVEPGARISFEMKPAGGSERPPVVFRGTNAAANDLLYQGKLLNGGPPDSERIAAVLASAPTAAVVLTALQGELRQPGALLATAFKQRQISRQCYEVLTAELEQRLLFWAGNVLLFHHNEPAKANLPLQMPDGEVRKLVAALATRYNPALPRYRHSALGNLGLLADLQAKGLLAGAPPMARTWGEYAAQFAPVNTLMPSYDYLPPATQGPAMGDVVLTALAFNAMSAAEFTKVFADYRRLFPTSPYVPIIARALPAAPKPAALASSQNQTFGRFSTGARALAFAPAPGLDTVQTLAALVRQQFRGRPVFVDFWASWCGPCIAEFRHEDPLHDFLSKNGIEALYVSVDKPGMRDKWAALAVQNNLRGYHYLASPAVQKATERDFTQIPRYLLFDKNGTLVEPDAYHPSAGEKLYRQLRERLQLH